MHKNSFMADVKRIISQKFPDCSVESVNVTKNNNVKLNGIIIRPQGSPVAPTVYIDHYYAALRSGRPFESVLDGIEKDCRAALQSAAMGIDPDFINDFSNIRDNICYKLISSELNKELLASIPHRDFYGLSVAYFVRLGTTDDGTSTVTVTDSMAQLWGTDEETLYRLARRNTPRLNRGTVLTLSDTISGCIDTSQARSIQEYDGFDFSTSRDEILPMYVATNRDKIFGAAVILYDGLLDAVTKHLCCSGVYALPSSIHEFMFISDTFGPAEDIKQMVTEINAAEVRADEVLSDNIYHYDAESHELTVIS